MKTALTVIGCCSLLFAGISQAGDEYEKAADKSVSVLLYVDKATVLWGAATPNGQTVILFKTDAGYYKCYDDKCFRLKPPAEAK